MYRASCDDEIRAVLEMREKSRRDKISKSYNAEKRDMKKGMEKGKLEIAEQLLKRNFPIEEISEITGISVDKLDKLKG